VLWQFDLLTDAAAAELHASRLDPTRREKAEKGLKALAGGSADPRFVGLNSLS
jgi:hypothetical protein